MADRVETRELEYFVAVAEELNIGRAAARLGIAQPPLSRAIARLERRLGVPLLERHARGVTLTPPGEVLLREARRVLDAVDAAVRRTRREGTGRPGIVLAMKPGGDGGLLPSVLAAYEARPGAVPVEVLMRGIGECGAALRDGSADVALLHAPYEDLDGLDTEELMTEGQVLVVPRSHRLACRGRITMAELAGERLFDRAEEDVTDAGQLMQRVALGRTAVLAPASVRDYLRRDLACVPVLDAPAVTVVLAWPEGSRSAAVAALVRTASEVAFRGRTGETVDAAAARPVEKPL